LIFFEGLRWFAGLACGLRFGLLAGLDHGLLLGCHGQVSSRGFFSSFLFLLYLYFLFLCFFPILNLIGIQIVFAGFLLC
jgi:hypothetical protein